ncbi:MAG: S8 family serine peptidase [Chloroflexi bacterium]|nr:S8 family serine peptidase [Chloroflexota bacterium]
MARIVAVLAAIVAASIWLAPLATAADPEGTPRTIHAGALDEVVLARLDPLALKTANEQGWVDVIVRSQGEGLLDRLGQIEGVQERRRAVVVALQANAAVRQRSLLQALAAGQTAGRVRALRPFWIFNGVAATVDRQTLLAIAARPDVAAVRFDRVHQLRRPVTAEAPAVQIEWQVERVRADQVWSGLAIDGRGVVVGIVDTGVDWQHPALRLQYRGYRGREPAQHLGNWTSTTGEPIVYPYDGFGHGTAVAGLILGFDGTRHTGVAPGSQWIAAKAFNSVGTARDSWIHAALEWMLAPSGDPSLAPDVVNNSWSADTGLTPEFREDVRSLLAAGILPIFAAGNNGPEAGSVAAPASYPESFGVGAVDRADRIANFSARGPSPFGVTKPDAVAPGVDVGTTAAGGSFQLTRGTSAAAPIAAGIAALVMQARPSITPTEMARVLTSTAIVLGSAPPDNTAGWGRLDAFAAVAAVSNAGRVVGSVADSTGAPIPGAVVEASGESSGARLASRTDANGRYGLALAPDIWQISAGAFGYFDSPLARAAIRAGETVSQTFQLVARPTGAVVGRVVDRWTGVPVTATIAISGQAVETRADATGRYRLTVPTGSHTLVVAASGYRRARQTVAAVAGGSTFADFDLTPAPRILLVDGGVWYDDSSAGRFGAALDALDYLFVTHPITSLARPLAAADLAGFDLVIWSSPLDSPGLSKSHRALIEYLEAGGKVLLSGQNVAYWDDGPGLATLSGYLRRFAHTRFADELNDAVAVQGQPIEIFQGVTLTLNTADSATNQNMPDVLAPLDDLGLSVFSYDRGAIAATRSASCLPSSVILLGFGLEGSGPTASRQTVLARAVEWLSGPATAEFQAALLPRFQVAAPGSSLDHPFTVRNTGRLPQVFEIGLTGGAWPKTLLDAARRPLPATVTLAPCELLNASVVVTAPLEAQRATVDTSLITVTALGAAPVQRTLPLTVVTPAPVLLVDHDFAFPTESAYTTTLSRLNVPFDRWDTTTLGSPPVQTLRQYRDVIWFSGYDWHEPVSPADERALAAYLDGGGRLLLSSQDYLAPRGPSPFATGYLGVLTYTIDVTAGVVAGVAGNPVGDGVDRSRLTLPFSDWSDAVTPTVGAQVAFRDRLDRPAGIVRADAARQAKTAFLAFALEGLPDAARDRTVLNALRWFDPLAASSLAVRPARAEPGDELEYHLTLADLTGAERQLDVGITTTGGATFRTEGLGDGPAPDGRGGLAWSGSLPAGAKQVLRFRARVNPAVRGAVVVEAQLRTSGQDELRLQASALVPFRAHFPAVARNGLQGGAQGW